MWWLLNKTLRVLQLTLWFIKIVIESALEQSDDGDYPEYVIRLENTYWNGHKFKPGLREAMVFASVDRAWDYADRHFSERVTEDIFITPAQVNGRGGVC